MKEDKNFKYISREISWLSFNERVLQEAADKKVPLIERLKFLGIFSSNLDEFFRVRVATIRRMMDFKKSAKEVLGDSPAKIMRHIHTRVVELQKQFDSIYTELAQELASHKIFIINEKQLNAEQGRFVKNYFNEKVLPALVPIMVDEDSKFPYLKDKSIYFAVRLSKKKHGKAKQRYAIMQIPSDVIPRFLILPKLGDNRHIILLDDVIRYCLSEVFSIFDFDTAEAYTIKLTRDAELGIDNDLSKGIVEKVTKGLKQRNKGVPVRLVYDKNMPREFVRFVTNKIKLSKDFNLIAGGRYHNFKDFISFPKVGPAGLTYNIPKPLHHPALEGQRSVLDVVKKKDVLLSYPYQSFNHIIDLLREASIDPDVTSIKITLYRIAKNSHVAYILSTAVKNGKQVTAVVEPQARFDEETNISAANQLQEEGVNVIYGVPGLKVHAKLFLITRKEDEDFVNYAHIGTGNFNEATATIYGDHSLLTSDERLTDEVEKVFTFLSNNYKAGNYKHLLVSPFFMRKKIYKYIAFEIEQAQAGKKAEITIKLNNLADRDMVKKLYQASQQGVKVNLIVRSSCSVVPGVQGLSENIEAISIVDKYLEHARVFIFHHGGEDKMYISSADWMFRNFDQRVEVACPIYDKAIRQEIKTIIDLQLNDNIKARIIDKKQANIFKFTEQKKAIRSQDEIFAYFKNKLK